MNVCMYVSTYVCMYVCVRMETDNMLKYGNEANKWWNIIYKKKRSFMLVWEIKLFYALYSMLFEMIHDRALSN